MRTARRSLFCALAGCGLLASASVAAATPACLLASPGFDRTRASSAECLSCHDGTCASAVSGERSHPVERLYAIGWVARSASLRPIPDRAIALSEGRVTCASCHDGGATLPHRTALPQDRLCQGCHER
jgi:hypothetical protein